ncbi:MAG: hypothetical protein ACOX6P_04365 [Candidatus Merdivicinus sp.]|jgi:hypothetical protein
MKLYQPQEFDYSGTKTYDVWDRRNLVRIDNISKLSDPVEPFSSEELEAVSRHILEARANNRPVIVFYGAHVIKCGLSRYLIDLIRRGLITHIASNGAGSIHDFELAYLGGTSEHVPTAIEDGSFGMWEQTGGWMNEAINEGAARGYGYGESLAHYVDEHPEKFPYREDCVFYNAYTHGVPATYHVTMGTDIIHEHPLANFSCIGGTSGRDFKIFVNSLKDLEGGVFLNIGSAVTGPEVFLKALSIVRNHGYMTRKITTANFDIIPLGDYKSDVSDTHFHYYYRPRKNIMNRPVSLGGNGYYIYGNHKQTVPTLYHLLTDEKKETIE